MTKKTIPESAIARELLGLREQMAPAQVAALDELAERLGQDRGTVLIKALSVGLFAIGLDGAGDFALSEITDALYGKDSDDSTAVYNQIADAGSDAWTRWNMIERAERVKVYAKADVEVNA